MPPKKRRASKPKQADAEDEEETASLAQYDSIAAAGSAGMPHVDATCRRAIDSCVFIPWDEHLHVGARNLIDISGDGHYKLCK
jgi:hypothetical protein